MGFADELYTGEVVLQKTVTFQGCRAATFMLKGNIPQAIDELEAAIQNGLTALKTMQNNKRVVPGSGAVETQLSLELKQYAKSFSGREQLAVEFYADALMDISSCLAENYGLNPAETVAELRNRHVDDLSGFGVCEQGCLDKVCFEPIAIKRSVIKRACEVSSLLLRIDKLIISKEIAKFHKQ